MDDESIFEVSSSEFDSLPDTADSSETDSLASPDSDPAEQDTAEQTEPEEQEPPEPIEQGSSDSSFVFSDSSSVDVVLSDGSSIEVREDSSSEAVTPVSSVSVTMDNSDILYRMERLEGRQVSLLYTQYILISLLISGFIIKMIFHFTSFDR